MARAKVKFLWQGVYEQIFLTFLSVCSVGTYMYVCMYVCMYVRTYVCMYELAIKLTAGHWSVTAHF